MKKTLILGVAGLLLLSGCSGMSSSKSVSTAAASAAASSSVTSSAAEAERKVWTNLTWLNNGNKVGDNDGPAYVVYSKKGYNKASQVIKVSKMELNLVRKSDKKTLNGYAFIGIDIYNAKTGQWTNCIDAGLGFIGSTGKCHACINRYSVPPDEETWWESSVELDMTHDYKLVLDASQKDEEVTLSVYDVTTGDKKVDSKTFTLYYAKADGSNIAVYQDYAMDYPDDVRYDTNNMLSDDWEQITLYNTNEGLYMKNIIGTDLCLYDASGCHPWTADRTADRFMWPDKTSSIPYVTTTVTQEKEDYETIIDLNMNH
jgi:hypothetical protein